MPSLALSTYQAGKMSSAIRSDNASDKKYSPYRVLWIRVYVRAAFDYAQYRDARDIRRRKDAEDAERWLFKESKLFNSFRNICEQLDLPIDLLRKIASRMTKDDVKKMEYLERDGWLALKFEELEAAGSEHGGNVG